MFWGLQLHWAAIDLPLSAQSNENMEITSTLHSEQHAKKELAVKLGQLQETVTVPSWEGLRDTHRPREGKHSGKVGLGARPEQRQLSGGTRGRYPQNSSQPMTPCCFLPSDLQRWVALHCP